MANKTVTVKPSGGDYATLAAAIAGELVANANLVTMEGILTISIEGSWSGSPDTTAATVSTSGFTTSAAYYLKIIADSANAFAGKWDTTKYILQSSSYNDTFAIETDYCRIEGLQIEQTEDAENNIRAIAVDNITETNNQIEIVRCCTKSAATTTNSDIGIYIIDTYAKVNIWNSVVWNVGATAGSRGILCMAGPAGGVVIENCTISGGYYGIQNGGNGVVKAINVLIVNTANLTFYDYDYADGTSYNAGDDTAAPGTNVQDSVSVTFVNAAAGDFHLVAGDTDVIDLGTASVTLGFTDDVDGVARAGAGAAWDIGADEYGNEEEPPEEGSSVPVMMASYRRRRG